jgi:hypothetical protein
MKKKIKMVLLIILIIILVVLLYLFYGAAPQSKEIVFGVNFSQKHSQNLGLDWKENYLALLDEMNVKDIKLITHWDLIETKRDSFYFEDLDWQIDRAKEKNAKILLVIGMKTGRWPECHLPQWAKGLSKAEQQERVLNLVEKIVLRYRENSSIWAFDVENEPLFPFGECPWRDKNFLKKEIQKVRSLDTKNRPILISDSGEGSFWLTTANLADIVGVTMYQKVWFKEINSYVAYPFPPVFYWRKSQIIKKLFKKEVICVELQAEPWCPNLLYDCSMEEQKKTMNLEQFKLNIEFAKKTGFDKFYLWGSEWWYQMKKQDFPQIWEEAKKLF